MLTAAVLVRGNTTVVKETQLSNAPESIVATAAGIAIEVNPELANALAFIVISELGRSTDCKAEQPLNASIGTACVPAGIDTWPFAGSIKQAHFGMLPE
jgi:hypothetical protein